MTNKHKPHLLIFPEDDANRQIANGFLMDPRVQQTRVQVMPLAGGWRKAVLLVAEAELTKYAERHLLLLIDFDDDEEDRKQLVLNSIDPAVRDRVFVLGVKSEPERLRTALGHKGYEKIGGTLCDECATDPPQLWSHVLLQHNESERQRLRDKVCPFLLD